jgi:hypothetical protein
MAKAARVIEQIGVIIRSARERGSPPSWLKAICSRAESKRRRRWVIEARSLVARQHTVVTLLATVEAPNLGNYRQEGDSTTTASGSGDVPCATSKPYAGHGDRDDGPDERRLGPSLPGHRP